MYNLRTEEKYKVTEIKTRKIRINNLSLSDYVAAKVKILRKNKELTQQELAERLGVTRVSVSNIEAARHFISVSMLERLCKALSCKSTDILPF